MLNIAINFVNQKKCEPDPYWRDKIKNGRPSKWDLPTEVSVEWSESEKRKLLELLSRLPDELKAIPFDGFYRMRKSVDIINPGTTNKSGDVIVIYDRAFENPFLSTIQTVVHEFGHIIYLNFKESDRQSYRDYLKWTRSPTHSESRSGSFISSRSKDNVDEDFAENISFFLLEPLQAKAIVPLAYEWISQKFSKKFKLKEECQNGKK